MVSWNPNKDAWMGKEAGRPIYHREGVCLSTDTKPVVGIGNGSILVEMDTSTIYHFDSESKTWLEFGEEAS